MTSDTWCFMSNEFILFCLLEFWGSFEELLCLQKKVYYSMDFLYFSFVNIKVDWTFLHHKHINLIAPFYHLLYWELFRILQSIRAKPGHPHLTVKLTVKKKAFSPSDILEKQDGSRSSNWMFSHSFQKFTALKSLKLHRWKQIGQLDLFWSGADMLLL